MNTTQPAYVLISRRFMPRKQRWETYTNVGTEMHHRPDKATLGDDYVSPDIACYEVLGAGTTNNNTVVAIVIEWLLRGRPAIMNVREIWTTV